MPLNNDQLDYLQSLLDSKRTSAEPLECALIDGLKKDLDNLPKLAETKLYSNVKDIVYCHTNDMATDIFDFLIAKGYKVGMSSAGITTGTLGDCTVKKLDVFKKWSDLMDLTIVELIDREMILAAGNDLINALQHIGGEYYDQLRQRKEFKLYGIMNDDKYVGAFQVEKDGSITTCVGFQNKRFKAKEDRDILLKIKSFIEDNNLAVDTDHLKELDLL